MRLASIVLALSLVTMAASAQTPTAQQQIVTHFRAYQAAHNAGDLATAEREATAAYDASIAASGDGNPTAVLAINLAATRLDLGRVSDALAPAQRAQTIVAARAAAAQVDPLLVSLLLGQLELMSHDDRGAQRVRAALEAGPSPSLAERAYTAAATLAVHQFEARRFAESRWAFGQAARWATDGAGANSVYARGRALTGEGASLINMRRERVEAYRLFVEAENTLAPLVASTASLDITLAEQAYYTAMAWHGLTVALLNSEGDRYEPIPLRGATASCVRLRSEPRPKFPPSAISRGGVGAVVVRMRMDAQGNVLDRRVVAAVPDRDFTSAVDEVLPLWQIEVISTCPPNTSAVASLIFMFESP